MKNQADQRNPKPSKREEPKGAVPRRDFLVKAGVGAAGLALGGAALATWGDAIALPGSDSASTTTKTASKPSVSVKPAGPADLAVIRGEDPSANVRKAVDAIGGMKKFVKSGDVVVVKPNIGWNRTVEMAANTNPAVVAALVAMALEAGAKTVKVFDNTCGNARSCYKRSGIEDAAREAGAVVLPFDGARCKTVPVPKGRFLTEWPVFTEALDADCFINVPVAKVHGISRVTLGMKNMMGVIGGNRGHWHKKIHLAVSEFLGVIKPQLTVIDAYRIMISNGPTGGSLEYVRMPKTCIASANPVAADARAVKLFDIDPDTMPFIKNAHALGYGEMDLAKLNIVEQG